MDRGEQGSRQLRRIGATPVQKWTVQSGQGEGTCWTCQLKDPAPPILPARGSFPSARKHPGILLFKRNRKSAHLLHIFASLWQTFLEIGGCGDGFWVVSSF
uniref:Uncharacterized protein n=1 Tax=Mus musculus TaxID=10090 RepID=Q3UVP7_MOUSE|nr:unnamed protein product [Mus musculus]